MIPKYRIIPIGSGVPSGGYATSISVTMDENYVLSVQLLNQNGDPLGDEQTVDLPLESVVVSGSYDDQNKQLILTLDNGNTIEIPISGLISGLQAEITAQNPLSADYLTDGSTNKVFTATEQSKLSGIEAGAEVNVQANWNETDSASDAYIQNKPTIPAAQVNADWDAASGVAQILNKPTIPAAVSGTDDGTNWTSITIGSDTKAIPSGGSNAWYGTQWEFDHLQNKDADTDYFISDKIDYNTDIVNKPDLSSYATKTEVNTKNTEQDSAIASKISGLFMTQQEFEQITPKEGDNYFIQGDIIEVVVTFTDQTTATYNVVVD